MRFIYTFAVYCYGLCIRIAALFNLKARQWVGGRRDIFAVMEAALKEVDRSANPLTWFHVSSLGEFEQGRPLIEAFRIRWPEKKVLLTFFSPSGYEVRKNYEQADFVFYLPLDTPANTRRFLGIIQPEMVFFVKYDFWFNYLKTIHLQKIPVYFISALFRPGQHFFSWYGGWFRKHLHYVNHFFVQDFRSAELLNSAGIHQVSVAGDTRFDRVFALAAQHTPMPLIERFRDGKQLFIAGSTWEPDEAIILPLTHLEDLRMKFIIVPHDTSPARIRFIKEKIDRPVICYSELDESSTTLFDVMIVDSVGILSQLYRYATVAYIGGGFGSGIHNIQEPVTFGVPVLFGPNYQKFREARDLITLGGASCISTSVALVKKVREIAGNPTERDRMSAVCRSYVEKNKGATMKILKFIEELGDQ